MALPTARQFLRDAAGRYVAFDGRLWRTLAALVFRPGFLTREYFGGRRRRYIRPARLFLVLSLLLFVVVRFSLGVTEVREGAFVLELAGSGTPSLPTAAAPSLAGSVAPGRDGTDTPGRSRQAAAETGEPESLALPGLSIQLDEHGDFRVEGGGPVADALRARMKRFNALPREARVEQVVLGAVRYGPYAMFVLLPAFALLLMAVYAWPRRPDAERPRRYAQHLVFAAHNHAFFFLIATIAVVLPAGAPKIVLALWSLAYGLWSMKAVYGGRWAGVLARAGVLGAGYGVLFAIATAGLLLAAIVAG